MGMCGSPSLQQTRPDPHRERSNRQGTAILRADLTQRKIASLQDVVPFTWARRERREGMSIQPTNNTRTVRWGERNKKRISDKKRAGEMRETPTERKRPRPAPRTWLRDSSLALRLALVHAMSAEIVKTPAAPGTPNDASSVRSFVKVFTFKSRCGEQKENKRTRKKKANSARAKKRSGGHKRPRVRKRKGPAERKKTSAGRPLLSSQKIPEVDHPHPLAQQPQHALFSLLTPVTLFLRSSLCFSLFLTGALKVNPIGSPGAAAAGFIDAAQASCPCP